MNGNFFQNPTFPSNTYSTPPGNMSINTTNNTDLPPSLTLEQIKSLLIQVKLDFF